MFPYVKMVGIGNDFVVLDARESTLPALNLQKIANRDEGIGCDQVIVLEPSSKADVKMRIINADGGEVEACGNATRCVAWLLQKPKSTIETVAGILKANLIGDEVEVDMGEPKIIQRELPFEGEPVEVNIGNPHLVFFRHEIDAMDMQAFGEPIEHHFAFANRTNVEVVEVLSPTKLKMRVWERGAGETQACGTGACAVAAAAIERGIAESPLTVQMLGGDLQIHWEGEGSSLLMQGAVSLIYRGELDVDKFKA